MDIRLKTEPFEFDGRTFQLCCNMNVLAEVQEAFGGSFYTALRSNSSIKGLLTFLTAMLNDYADQQGWDVHYEAAQVGRMLDPSAAAMAKRNSMIMGLVTAALTPAKQEDREEPEKN